MNNLNTMYVSYKKETKIKLRKAVLLHREINSKIKYLYSCIEENKEDIYNYDTLISLLKDYNKTGNNKSAVSAKSPIKYPKIVKAYVNSLISHMNRRRVVAKYGNILLVKNRLRQENFGLVVKSFNKEIANNILTGYSHNFGHGLSSIQIETKEKIYRHGDKARKSIDQGESNKTLYRLIEEVDPNLLKDYRNKKISREIFHARAKQYTYHPTRNPEGKKWIIYHLDDEFPYIVWKKKTSIVPNRGLYWFSPTLYINTENRSMNMLCSELNTKQDVLDNDDIGFINKLILLNKLDRNYKNKFRK